MLRQSWVDFELTVKRLAEFVPANTRALCPIPRGGLVLAVALSYRTGLPLVSRPEKRTVLVADMVDTGQTLADWRQLYGPLPALAWFRRSTASEAASAVCPLHRGELVLFPWEMPQRAAVAARSAA